MAAPMRATRLFVTDWRSVRRFSLSAALRSPQDEKKFDERMLQYLVCPVSKTPLRYDKENNELVCDNMHVAYPIVNGIPNLVPTDARKITEVTKDTSTDNKNQPET
ncbi:uncharacterized protein LOC106173711 [Lingula anatina]|uniref:Protein preY, mitochondrial n=1 Tax=Lingula anatina TaxID=7574 RepID=A0A1S3JJR2_LINAN|nr:uncharacterized protein LOC106173711 [Lingula anatina]|eukprot:XP_013410376.1 uncharacterized protein LOC106173711 [Lingula anatina]